MIKINRVQARTLYRKGISVYIGKDKIEMSPFSIGNGYGNYTPTRKGNFAFSFESQRIRENLKINKLTYYKKIMKRETFLDNLTIIVSKAKYISKLGYGTRVSDKITEQIKVVEDIRENFSISEKENKELAKKVIDTITAIGSLTSDSSKNTKERLKAILEDKSLLELAYKIQ
tara:strand:+ start:214 stop:732 length:519 start_codon:yes stop_codon:yes gene_type:complete